MIFFFNKMLAISSSCQKTAGNSGAGWGKELRFRKTIILNEGIKKGPHALK